MASFGPDLGLALRQRSSAFNPAMLFSAGEAGAWYDVSDPGTLFQDAGGGVAAAIGSPVGLVRDKSGRGNQAVQAGAAARPLLKQGGGGRAYLDFDGVDDHLTTALVQPVAQPTTMFIAGRKTAIGDHSYIDGSSGTGRLMIGSRSGEWCLFAGGAVLGSGVPEAIATVILAAAVDGANSFLRVNGAGGQAGDAGGDGASGLMIGRSPVAPDCFMGGRIYGLLVVGRALSGAEFSAAERWFGQQYGVPL